MVMKMGGVIFFVSLVIGLYFLNLGFNLIVLPESVSSVIATPMEVLGGILLIVGGFFAMRAMRPVAVRR